MLWIARANGTNCWRRLYIYLQYIAPHMRYGANQFFVAKNVYGNMHHSVAY